MSAWKIKSKELKICGLGWIIIKHDPLLYDLQQDGKTKIESQDRTARRRLSAFKDR